MTLTLGFAWRTFCLRAFAASFSEHLVATWADDALARGFPQVSWQGVTHEEVQLSERQSSKTICVDYLLCVGKSEWGKNCLHLSAALCSEHLVASWADDALARRFPQVSRQGVSHGEVQLSECHSSSAISVGWWLCVEGFAWRKNLFARVRGIVL